MGSVKDTETFEPLLQHRLVDICQMLQIVQHPRNIHSLFELPMRSTVRLWLALGSMTYNSS
jgi:hypothetical protein